MPPKSNKEFLSLELPKRFNLKNAILVILILGGFYLLLPRIVGLGQTFQLLRHINKFYILLALCTEIISYIGAAWLLGIILSRLGHNLNFITRFRLGSISAFTIHFVPLGAAGQATFDYYFLRKQKVDAGSIVLMWILRLIFTYSGLFMVLLVGLALVPTYPVMSFSPRIISIALLLIILFEIFYLIWLYQHKEKFWSAWSKLFDFANRILIMFKKNPIDAGKKQQVFDDAYHGIGLFGQKKRSSLMAIMAALIYWLGDIMCLYFVFLSFGYHIRTGILFFSYCVSTLLGIISAIPGGMGVTEGSLTLIASGMGVPSAIALTATLVFRFFSFWIWIPIGFLSYLALSKARK